ncbi:MAG TPA: TIGR03086 family metal-binding protein [Candidatus Dormibacteraeota bacterium]|jgi:uncharacterized protein (TIGR03086 family)|nr:TIGR03086 family metal-binding protein [Candidatus Dormibacteraeota bacterium]
MSWDENLDLLRRALDQTGTVIERVTPDQHGLPTPCGDWDVTTLVTHVTGGLDKQAAMARGESPDWRAPMPPLGDDWAADFRAKAAVLLDAWRSAGPAQHPHAEMHIAEQAVHSWDIARATGTPDGDLDPAIAEHALAWSRGMLKPEWRGAGGGGAFGDEVPVPDDAPVYDRLAGWFGRNPADWPST